MFGWLQKKAENSRVYMVTKEVLWELEAAPMTRRAVILVVAQGLRLVAMEPSGIPRNLLSRPLDYPRTDLTQAYNFVEDARNANTMQLSDMQKTSKRFGIDLPDFMIDHAKAVGRGLDVWLATIGAGIAPDMRDQTRDVWGMLSGSTGSLVDAIREIRTIEQGLAQYGGQPASSMFGDLTNEELVEACYFLPESFQQRL